MEWEVSWVAGGSQPWRNWVPDRKLQCKQVEGKEISSGPSKAAAPRDMYVLLNVHTLEGTSTPEHQEMGDWRGETTAAGGHHLLHRLPSPPILPEKWSCLSPFHRTSLKALEAPVTQSEQFSGPSHPRLIFPGIQISSHHEPLKEHWSSACQCPPPTSPNRPGLTQQ